MEKSRQSEVAGLLNRWAELKRAQKHLEAAAQQLDRLEHTLQTVQEALAAASTATTRYAAPLDYLGKLREQLQRDAHALATRIAKERDQQLPARPASLSSPHV